MITLPITPAIGLRFRKIAVRPVEMTAMLLLSLSIYRKQYCHHARYNSPILESLSDLSYLNMDIETEGTDKLIYSLS